MIAALAEAALRSFALGGVVWIGLILFRVRNQHVHMTAWVVVLLASLAMPFVMHWPTLTLDRMPLSVPVPDESWPADFSMLASICSMTGCMDFCISGDMELTLFFIASSCLRWSASILLYWSSGVPFCWAASGLALARCLSYSALKAAVSV